MPGTPINTAKILANGPSCTVALSVQAGDLIVASFVVDYPYAYTPPWSFTVFDTDLNVYEMRTIAGPGLGVISCAWAIAKATGTINITYGESASVWHNLLVSNIRWNDGEAPTLAEWACDISRVQYAPSPDPPWHHSALTSYFSLADSTIVSFAMFAGSPVPINFESDTGDTLVETSDGSPVTQQVALFYRNSTGPGVGNVKIKNSWTGGELGQNPSISMVFSRPLARPGGLTEQYQVRPGCGAQESPGDEGGTEGPYYIAEINRPISVTLPYLPVVGNLLCVGVTSQVLNTTPVVSDNAGNVYTIRGNSLIVGPNGCMVAIFTCIVAALPPSGLPLIIEASLPGPYSAVTYQPSSMNVTEQNLSGLVVVDYQFAPFASISGMNLLSDSLTVPAGSYLFGVAAYAIGAGSTVTWTGQNGFTERSSSSFIQITGQQSNAAYCGPSAIIDLYPGADGTYHAEAEALTDLATSPVTGGIALLGVTLESDIPPPPEECITVPVPAYTPDLIALQEPLEQQGS